MEDVGCSWHDYRRPGNCSLSPCNGSVFLLQRPTQVHVAGSWLAYTKNKNMVKAAEILKMGNLAPGGTFEKMGFGKGKLKVVV